MTRRLKVPFSLARKRIRASFNKYNVYNALTWRKNRPLGTQYREVFAAKQESRAYHGDRLSENQFKNHFRGDLPVVSPLQSSAKSDGRASEADIPYALQTFVGLERRLDFAVFRSLFASSIRQAAHFILRGSVKVNGVRIKSPGYILKAGDVISVDPRRVLQAMGRPKPSISESVKRTNALIAKFNKYIDRCHKNPEQMFRQRQKNRRRHHVYSSKYSARSLKRSEATNAAIQNDLNEKVKAVKPQSVLESIFLGTFQAKKPAVMGTVREIRRLAGLEKAANIGAGAEKVDTEAKRTEKADTEAKKTEKVDTEVKKTVKTEKSGVAAEKTEKIEKTTQESSASSAPEAPEASSAASSASAASSSASSAPSSASSTPSAAAYYDSKASVAPAHRGDIKKLVNTVVDSERDALTAEYAKKFVKPGEEKYDPEWVKRLPAKLEPVSEEMTPEQLGEVKLNLPFSTTGGKLYGLAEPKKTWFTPWSPRQFMAPFAILPHHIEVDFETCHAVYMRDPVARPGQSEVVSPFSLDMHERVYLWYIFRRRKNLPNCT